MFRKIFIGGRERPYLIRWYLLPRNRWLNLYLHKFLRSDADREKHDHPWWFVSLMLRGKYLEETDVGKTERVAPSICFRRAEHRHRVELFRDAKCQEIPCWTIVLTGPVSREWGFWCPKGFVPWSKYLANRNDAVPGSGCGE